jgi:shikimate kinase/3-dehydroquinate synthase
VLVGFMGAGKSTLGPELAERLGREFVSVDAVIEARTEQTIPAIFSDRGEPAFLALEEETAAEILAGGAPAVVELGGGGIGSTATRSALATRAFTLRLETTADEAWGRVAGSDRPLARDEHEFRSLFEQRASLYAEVADGSARDADGAVLAAGGIHVEESSVALLAGLVPGDDPVELVIDANVSAIHGPRVRDALGTRVAAIHEVPPGEESKSIDEAKRLWAAMRLDRRGTVVAVGGGTALDLAGFTASTYLRGVAWAPVPTTLVAQVDAAIGGKTAVDLPGGKNLVGTFHWPTRVIVDPELLATLPDEERQYGLAEVVKTGLLAGEAVWELPTAEQVRRCAAFKVAVCLRDPHDRGVRAQLNLGHTFAHALEAASDYALPHGRAVALGLVAACRISGLEDEARLVEELLRPERVAVDREVAWAALTRDKKALAGSARLVLLDAPGRPRTGVEVEESVLRGALDELIR